MLFLRKDLEMMIFFCIFADEFENEGRSLKE